MYIDGQTHRQKEEKEKERKGKRGRRSISRVRSRIITHTHSDARRS
jgi:hypothetical protein